MSTLFRHHVLVVTMTVVATIAVAAGGGQSAREVFERARLLEATNAASPEVIKLYEQAAALAKSDRALAAQSWLGVGRAQERAGRAEARATFERVVKEFPDQPQARATAEGHLARLQAEDGPFTSRDIEALIARDEYFGAILPKTSPDGKWVMFLKVHGVRTNTPDVSLCVRNLETGTERVLMAGRRGDRQWTAWSVDSRRLAVSLRILEGQTTRREIHVFDLSSPNAKPIVLPSLSGSREQIYPMFAGWLNMPWSPNGRYLPYPATTSTANVHEIRLLDVTTGATRPLGQLPPTDITQRVDTPANTPPQIRWSPDGREIVMRVADASGAQQLRIVPLNGGPGRTLTLPGESGTRVQLGEWTTRGLVVEQAEPSAPQLRLVSLVEAATGTLTRICEQRPAGFVNQTPPRGMSLRATDTDLCVGVTRDGMTLLRWDVATQRIMVRNLSNGEERPLTRGSGEERGPQLTLDDRTVLFVSNRDGRWALYAVPLAGAPVANPLVLARLDTLPSAFEVRPTDDGFLVNASYWEGDIWRLDLDPQTRQVTGEPQRLTQEGNQNHSSAVSPDGKSVAYWSRHGYRMNLAVMDASGANERIVKQTDQPTNHGYWRTPVWRSPDEVLYSVYSPVGTGSRQFFTINVRSGGTQLHAFPELERVRRSEWRDWQFLPARQEMVFIDTASPAGSTVFRARPLAGGETRTVATLNVPETSLSDFLISPDGTLIAFATGGKWQVYDVAKQAMRSALGNFTSPTDWSKDGRFVLFDAGHPRLLDAVTGQSLPLWDSPRQNFNWAADASLAPDLSFMTYSVPATRQEWRQWHGVTTDAVLRAMKARR